MKLVESDPLHQSLHHLPHQPLVSLMHVAGVMQANPAYALVASQFDAAHYTQQLTTLWGEAAPQGTPAQWLIHYMTVGWLDRLNPSSEFCVASYLDANPDVRAAGMEPLYHYMAHGRLEARLAFAVNSAPLLLDGSVNEPSADNTDAGTSLRQAIAPFFDSDFYLSAYPDVADAKLDPLDHYIEFGWKEKRDPSADFSTNDYLSAYEDVRADGQVPLLHYAMFGKSEGRATKTWRTSPVKLLSELASLEQRTRAWQRSPPAQLMPWQELQKILSSALLKLTQPHAVVALTHDRYYSNTGGIQACVKEEQALLNQAGFCYIAVNPYHPMPTLSANDISDWLCDVSINGMLVGILCGSDALKALERSLSNASCYLCVHCLLGHNPAWAESLAAKVAFTAHFFWVHDYFSICEGYALLRNDVTYCAAPPVDSDACHICVYGEGRAQHLTRLQSLFKSIGFNVLAPSDAALSLWLAKTRLPYKDTRVVPHLALKPTHDALKTQTTKSKLRVAFLGQPAAHKGWGFFTHLVDALQHDQRYEFFHLGAVSYPSEHVQHVVVDGRESTPTMQAAIEEYAIDIALVLSIWPETFCLTAYEAVAAGAVVFAFENEGHVTNMVSETGLGCSYGSFDDLLSSFRSGAAVRKHQELSPSVARHQLIHSGVTGSVILATIDPALVSLKNEEQRVERTA